jgi:hypothetical protein
MFSVSALAPHGGERCASILFVSLFLHDLDIIDDRADRRARLRSLESSVFEVGDAGGTQKRTGVDPSDKNARPGKEGDRGKKRHRASCFRLLQVERNEFSAESFEIFSAELSQSRKL